MWEPVSRFLGGGAVVTRKSLASSKSMSFVLSDIIDVMAAMTFMSLLAIEIRQHFRPFSSLTSIAY